MTDLCKDFATVRPARRREAWRNGAAAAGLALARAAGVGLASVFILAGLVLLPLPIPLGVPFLTLGGVLLWRSCPPARVHARNWLAAHPGVQRRMRAILRRPRRRASRI